MGDINNNEKIENIENIETPTNICNERCMPCDEYLYDLSELFRIFGDSTRIKILYSLFEGELCVNDMSALLSLSQSSISHQLRILKDAKLVKFRREGKSIYYSLDDEHVKTILCMGMEHVEE